MRAFAAWVIIKIATSYHINKPDIATISHSGHTKYSSLGNMRSAVWEHFKKGKDDAECKHCGKTVKSKGGNTTNLMAHLKTNHFMVYSSLQKKKEHSSVRSVQNEVSSRIYLMFFSEQKSQFHTSNFAAEKYRKYRYYRYFFFDIDIRYFFNIATAY